MSDFKWVVEAVMNCEFDELHSLDQDEFDKITGLHEYYDANYECEDAALDEFHNTVPIKCLDNWDITVRTVEL